MTLTAEGTHIFNVMMIFTVSDCKFELSDFKSNRQFPHEKAHLPFNRLCMY